MEVGQSEGLLKAACDKTENETREIIKEAIEKLHTQVLVQLATAVPGRKYCWGSTVGVKDKQWATMES